MNILKSVRRLSLGALLLSATLLAGCGGSAPMHGTYATSEGSMSIRFNSGKAYITTLGGTIETAYKVDGDKILLKSPQGNLVLTRNGDGSLSGPMGTLNKKGASTSSKNKAGGRSLSGIYAMSNGKGGIGSIRFDAGRAYIQGRMKGSRGGGTFTLTTTYELRGNKVIIKDPQGGNDNMVLTRNANGTLSDPTGNIFRKQG